MIFFGREVVVEFPEGKSDGSMKSCSRCGQQLPISAFHRRGHYTKDGTRSACRECTAKDVKRLRDARGDDGRESGDAEARKKALVRARTRRAIEQHLITAEPCKECGEPDVEAHHGSYDGDRAHLDVTWLCKRHHALHHGERAWTRQLDLRH